MTTKHPYMLDRYRGQVFPVWRDMETADFIYAEPSVLRAAIECLALRAEEYGTGKVAQKREQLANLRHPLHQWRDRLQWVGLDADGDNVFAIGLHPWDASSVLSSWFREMRPEAIDMRPRVTVGSLYGVILVADTSMPIV